MTEEEKKQILEDWAKHQEVKKQIKDRAKP